jgi:CubicO group peptidase (beta-lactamase class C family)
MTATLLAILLEDKTIPDEQERGWDATLLSVLPDIAKATSYENVTLRQLVSHLSGIPSALSINLFQYENSSNDMRSVRKSVATIILHSTPLHPSGTAFHYYTDFGYIVAGHIIEEYTSMTWEQALKEYLFRPLGIDLGDNPLDYTGAPDNEIDPWGHKGYSQTPCDPSSNVVVCDNSAVLGPAGTFSGPVAAMAAYFAWHIRCHNGDIPAEDPSAALLSPESCQEMHQPADRTIGDYGYGWSCTERPWANGPTCTHTGSNNLNYYVVWLAFNIIRLWLDIPMEEVVPAVQIATWLTPQFKWLFLVMKNVMLAFLPLSTSRTRPFANQHGQIVGATLNVAPRVVLSVYAEAAGRPQSRECLLVAVGELEMLAAEEETVYAASEADFPKRA